MCSNCIHNFFQKVNNNRTVQTTRMRRLSATMLFAYKKRQVFSRSGLKFMYVGRQGPGVCSCSSEHFLFAYVSTKFAYACPTVILLSYMYVVYTAQVYLTLCILETPKRVLWQAVKTQMKCSIMLHFIRVFTVCLD